LCVVEDKSFDDEEKETSAWSGSWRFPLSLVLFVVSSQALEERKLTGSSLNGVLKGFDACDTDGWNGGATGENILRGDDGMELCFWDIVIKIHEKEKNRKWAKLEDSAKIKKCWESSEMNFDEQFPKQGTWIWVFREIWIKLNWNLFNDDKKMCCEGCAGDGESEIKRWCDKECSVRRSV
jgi:hypothetical protein